MKIKLLLIAFLYSLTSQAITIEKKLKLCSKKSQDDFTYRISTLNSVYQIDDKYLYPLKDFSLIKIRALNMIKSQSQIIDGKILWLLEFRPLPEQTQLSVEYYPRIILTCTKTVDSLTCSSFKEKADLFRTFKDFSFNLKYQLASVDDADCQKDAVLFVQYRLSVDEKSFQDLKKESLKQLTGSENNILANVIDKLFDPETLFATYIQHLYEQW